jgi:hypothetical protein
VRHLLLQGNWQVNLRTTCYCICLV